jgi:hypothetical protein
MEVEENRVDLYETTALERHEWQPGQDGKKPVKETEPDLKKLMDLEIFEAFRSNAQCASVGSAAAVQQIVTSGTKSTVKSRPSKTTRGPYRSYTPLQVQELLDLVKEEDFSARHDNTQKKKSDAQIDWKKPIPLLCSLMRPHQE